MKKIKGNEPTKIHIFTGNTMMIFSVMLSLAFNNIMLNSFNYLNAISAGNVSEKMAEVFNEKANPVPLRQYMSISSKITAYLKPGEAITLLEGRKNWFYVETVDGKKGFIDNRYVKTNYLPPINFNGDMKDRIVLSQSKQRLFIIRNNRVEKEFIISSGLEDTPTPNGIFIIEPGRRGSWFYSEKYKQGGKYWVGFRGNYLFHSIPMDRNQNIIAEELQKIGQPASHGCIRMLVEDAEWFYKNIPDGMPVIIRP